MTALPVVLVFDDTRDRTVADAPGGSSPTALRIADSLPGAACLSITELVAPGARSLFGSATHLVVVCRQDRRAHDAVAELDDVARELGIELVVSEVVVTVDARTMLDRLLAKEWVPMPERVGDRAPADSPAAVLVTWLEEATAVVADHLARLRPPARVDLLALLDHLNPGARVVRSEPTAPVPLSGDGDGAADTTPGWVLQLERRFRPVFPTASIGAFVYENVRPFHPGRICALVDGDLARSRWGTIVRSAGFCRLASAPSVLARWDQIGTSAEVAPVAAGTASQQGRGETGLGGLRGIGAIGQELAIMGVDLDRAGIIEALDACVLTDAEFAAGPMLWASFRDPLPDWAAIPAGE